MISEYLNVFFRLQRAPKLSLFDHCITVTEGCTIIGTDREILLKARELVTRYNFHVFDGIIVASALQAGCNILYPEDFQHLMVVENQLTIINPYLEVQ